MAEVRNYRSGESSHGGRRGNSVNEEFGDEVVIAETSLLLDLVEDSGLVLEDLNHPSAFQSSSSSLSPLPPWIHRILERETEGRERERRGLGLNLGLGDEMVQRGTKI
ncbi:hypothetical protein L484_004024 [Morus notabilis]|uniref:Uncharacterized protein n=1 Tax=Morus notabilis TaxID=981085 RepID=W9RAL5_9ROSA|nr:hypothetical protein L484_004024 [Morus notabilis]